MKLSGEMKKLKAEVDEMRIESKFSPDTKSKQ
jgi:hypothetical protein